MRYLLTLAWIWLLASACGTPVSDYHVKTGGNRELLGTDLISRYTVRLHILVKPDAQKVWTGGCSGTLLSPQYVLTAAHCVTLNPWRIKVVVGDTHPIELDNGKVYTEVAEVEAAMFHRRFNSSKLAWKMLAKPLFLKTQKAAFDVAVLKLRRPLNLPYRVDFTIPKTTFSLKGQEAIVAGYGAGDMGQVPSRGRQAKTKIADDFYDLLQFNNFFKRMNFGDSGGPVWRFADNGELELIGVNSFMLWLLRMRTYAIDIRHYRQWIYDAIASLKSGYHQPLTKEQQMHRLIMTGVAEDLFLDAHR